MNIWEPYGLRGSPFFQHELRLDDRDHPVSLLVGRDVELARLSRRIQSGADSRTIVQGGAGVGKTSFVNRLKGDALRAGLGAYSSPIRIQSDTSVASFAADVLRTLLRIRAGLGGGAGDDRFWKRTAQLVEGATLAGGSISVIGSGAGYQQGYAPPLAPLDFYEPLGEALERIGRETGGVVLHVNNLENVESPERAAILMRDLRDLFQLGGAHWVFVGSKEIETEVFRRFDQVSGIFPVAETLLPLTAPQIAELLSRRFRHLRLPRREMTPPVEPETASRLYGLYQGDLRNFLRLLSDAADLGLGLAAIRPMEADEILQLVRPGYRRALESSVGERDADYLEKLIAGTRDEGVEFRVTDAERLLSLKGGSQLLTRLEERGAVREVRREGRSIFYRPVGAVLAAFGILPE